MEPTEIAPTPAGPLVILHESEALLVLAKPAGIPVIPARGEPPANCLRAVAERQLGSRLWVVHRLDRDVSGVLVLAKTADEHRRLSMAFEHHLVAKSYWALVDGRVAEEEGVVELPLRSGLHGGKTVVDAKRGKPAVTHFRVVERFDRFSIIRLEPRTGRTHQIRVHLKAINHPLAVDRRYGKRAELTASDIAGRERTKGEPALVKQATLHGQRLELPMLEGDKMLVLEAPLPAELMAAVAANRAGASGSDRAAKRGHERRSS